MSLRNDAAQLRDRAEAALRNNPGAPPDASLVSEMQQVLADGKNQFKSELHPRFHWRSWPIPQSWTLESIGILAAAIHTTCVAYDNAAASELAKQRRS